MPFLNYIYVKFIHVLHRSYSFILNIIQYPMTEIRLFYANGIFGSFSVSGYFKLCCYSSFAHIFRCSCAVTSVAEIPTSGIAGSQCLHTFSFNELWKHSEWELGMYFWQVTECRAKIRPQASGPLPGLDYRGARANHLPSVFPQL